MLSTLVLLSTISFVSHALETQCSRIALDDEPSYIYPMDVCMVDGSTSYKYVCDEGGDPLRETFYRNLDCSGDQTDAFGVRNYDHHYYESSMCLKRECDYVTVEEFEGVTECGENFIPNAYDTSTKNAWVTNEPCEEINGTYKSKAISCQGSSLGYGFWSNDWCYGDQVDYEASETSYCSTESGTAKVITCSSSITEVASRNNTDVCNGIEVIINNISVFVPENVCIVEENHGDTESWHFFCDEDGWGVIQRFFENEDCSGSQKFTSIYHTEQTHCDRTSCSNYAVNEMWFGVIKCGDSSANMYTNYTKYAFIPDQDIDDEFCLELSETYCNVSEGIAVNRYCGEIEEETEEDACNGLEVSEFASVSIFYPENVCMVKEGNDYAESWHFVCNEDGEGVIQLFENRDCSDSPFMAESAESGFSAPHCGGTSCSDYIVIEEWSEVTECNYYTPLTYTNYSKIAFVADDEMCVAINETWSMAFSCQEQSFGVNVWNNIECEGEEYTFVATHEESCNVTEGRAASVTCEVYEQETEKTQNKSESEEESEESEEDGEDGAYYYYYNVQILSTFITFFVVLIVN